MPSKIVRSRSTAWLLYRRYRRQFCICWTKTIRLWCGTRLKVPLRVYVPLCKTYLIRTWGNARRLNHMLTPRACHQSLTVSWYSLGKHRQLKKCTSLATENIQTPITPRADSAPSYLLKRTAVNKDDDLVVVLCYIGGYWGYHGLSAKKPMIQWCYCWWFISDPVSSNQPSGLTATKKLPSVQELGPASSSVSFQAMCHPKHKTIPRCILSPSWCIYKWPHLSMIYILVFVCIINMY